MIPEAELERIKRDVPIVELEYVLAHRGGRGQQFVYELLYDGAGKDGRPFLVGLIDVDALRAGDTAGTLGGGRDGFGEPLGVALGPLWAGCEGVEIDENGNDGGGMEGEEDERAENAYGDEEALPYLYSSRSRGRAGEERA